MTSKKIDNAKDLRVGDVVAIIAHDGNNYATNEATGWFVAEYQVVADNGPLFGDKAVSVKNLKRVGDWPDKVLEVDQDGFGGELIEGNPIRWGTGHGLSDPAEVYLLHRAGEWNDDKEEK